LGFPDERHPAREGENGEQEMPFKNPHVSLVSFSVEINSGGTTDVLVVETDLHLNTRHSGYDAVAVQRLIEAVREYLADNSDRITHVRLVSNRSSQT
jgi:hypothetical protein